MRREGRVAGRQAGMGWMGMHAMLPKTRTQTTTTTKGRERWREVGRINQEGRGKGGESACPTWDRWGKAEKKV